LECDWFEWVNMNQLRKILNQCNPKATKLTPSHTWVHIMKKLALVVAVLNLTGCASMFTGTTSTINVTSTPTGADCDLAGHGVHTPGNIVISKSPDDITTNRQIQMRV
jgi:hypothetical protein